MADCSPRVDLKMFVELDECHDHRCALERTSVSFEIRKKGKAALVRERGPGERAWDKGLLVSLSQGHGMEGSSAA